MPQAERQILEEDESSITYREGGKIYTEMKPGAGLAALEKAEKVVAAQKKPQDFSKFLGGALARVALPTASGAAAGLLGGPGGAAIGGLTGAASGLLDVALNPNFSAGSTGANMVQAALPPGAKLPARLLGPALGAAAGTGLETKDPTQAALSGGATLLGGAGAEGLVAGASLPLHARLGAKNVQKDLEQTIQGTAQTTMPPGRIKKWGETALIDLLDKVRVPRAGAYQPSGMSSLTREQTRAAREIIRSKDKGAAEKMLKSAPGFAGIMKISDVEDQAKLISLYLDDVTRPGKSATLDMNTGKYLLNKKAFIERLDKDADLINALPDVWRDSLKDLREEVLSSPNPAGILRNPHEAMASRVAFRMMGGPGGAVATAAAEKTILPFVLSKELRELAEKGTDPLEKLFIGGTGRDLGMRLREAFLPSPPR